MKNLQDFVDRIKNMDLNGEDRLVSPDVKALWYGTDFAAGSLSNGV